MVGESQLLRLQQDYGDEARRRGVELKQLLASLADATDQQKLFEINQFFNQFAYVDDATLWREADYWSTPEEFIGMRQGDCEDFVIAKYFALREVGISESKLFLTYVSAVKLNVAHMVLTYFETPNSIPLVLDNYDARILPANQRSDLLPVYSFNARSFFLTDLTAGLGRQLPADQIKNSKWTELLTNLRESPVQ
ncbi:Uncharacterised protein [Zhongshania aliphaticivorans]|uniref:Transglutaminase n=2 Tax=Zhongshania aliphaticivorans TaxID=1470434 RepID=A0A5S9PSF3_9GAMM|nr:Uncharacterised protein [Zhongshania aliphaticivorans]CAA0107295.1 Uncharacterised protein [Zhongshania aliphaticivorans]